MAHNLSINKDGEAEMFSGRRETPWHKLGTVVDGLLSSKEALKTAKLNWTVEKRVLYAEKVSDSTLYPVENRFALMRSDNDHVFPSIVSDEYQPIQNANAFEILDAIVGTGEARFDTAGALHKGERVWMSAVLKNNDFDFPRKEKHELYLLLENSHNNRRPLTMQVVATRVVCQNTLSCALGEHSTQFKIHHLNGFQNKAKEAAKCLGLARSYMLEYSKAARALDSKAVTPQYVGKFISLLLPIPQEIPENAVERIQEKREIVKRLFEEGVDTTRQSRYDLLNAVTEYVTHESVRGKESSAKAERNFEQVIHGRGAELVSKALDLLLV